MSTLNYARECAGRAVEALVIGNAGFRERLRNSLCQFAFVPEADIPDELRERVQRVHSSVAAAGGIAAYTAGTRIGEMENIALEIFRIREELTTAVSQVRRTGMQRGEAPVQIAV